MAREKVRLVSDEDLKEKEIRNMISREEINQNNFDDYPEEIKRKVKEILFKTASEKVSLPQGLSSLEFVLLSYIRIMNKKVKGLALSAEDKKIESSLNRILEMHEITSSQILIDDWLFDYMHYAEKITEEVLDNRKNHYSLKKHIIGITE